ncbi:hypothetical protein MTO96_037124 [Rhipicephalus appendiculatus]
MAHGCTARPPAPARPPPFFLLIPVLLNLSTMASVASSEEACLRPPDSIVYESPLNHTAHFLPLANKSDEGLGWIYASVDALGSFLIPVPKIPNGQ